MVSWIKNAASQFFQGCSRFLDEGAKEHAFSSELHSAWINSYLPDFLQHPDYQPSRILQRVKLELLEYANDHLPAIHVSPSTLEKVDEAVPFGVFLQRTFLLQGEQQVGASIIIASMKSRPKTQEIATIVSLVYALNFLHLKMDDFERVHKIQVLEKQMQEFRELIRITFLLFNDLPQPLVRQRCFLQPLETAVANLCFKEAQKRILTEEKDALHHSQASFCETVSGAEAFSST